MYEYLDIARLVGTFSEASDVGGVKGLLVLFLGLVVFANVVVLILVAKNHLSFVHFLAVTKEFNEA